MPGPSGPCGPPLRRLSQTAWAQKSPKGTTPTPSGHRADGGVKVDWVARGRHGPKGPALPYRTPKGATLCCDQVRLDGCPHTSLWPSAVVMTISRIP